MHQEQVLKHLRAAVMFLGCAQEYAEPGSQLWLTCRRLHDEVDAVASELADYSIFDQPSEERIN